MDLILLNGPSSAGKSTIAKRLLARLGTTRECSLIALDDYMTVGTNEEIWEDDVFAATERMYADEPDTRAYKEPSFLRFGGGDSLPPERFDRRLKATYVKPKTAEERKPFIAKTLSSMQKGMPDDAGMKPDYQVGDRVSHIKFGEGEVLAMDETPRDTKVTVLFDEVGQKIMYAAFARLKKID